MKLNSVKTNKDKKRDAFTLIEMIGVLAVIAILAAMLIPRVFSAWYQHRREDRDHGQHTDHFDQRESISFLVFICFYRIKFHALFFVVVVSNILYRHYFARINQSIYQNWIPI